MLLNGVRDNFNAALATRAAELSVNLRAIHRVYEIEPVVRPPESSFRNVIIDTCTIVRYPAVCNCVNE